MAVIQLQAVLAELRGEQVPLPFTKVLQIFSIIWTCLVPVLTKVY
jgi:hypothetical protein